MRADLIAIEEAIEAEAAAAAQAVVARRRVDLLLARGAASEASPADPPNAPSLITRAELARALRTSVATVDRNTRAGMPCMIVSSRRRYDLRVVREWLETRPTGVGSEGTSSTDAIDIREAARMAGLRLVGEVQR